jgi:hypothetical protein
MVRNEQPGRVLPRSERTEPRMPRAEIPVRPPQRPVPPSRAAEPQPSAADQNLAEMAQRLEAALRRPGGEPRVDAPEARAPSVNPGERISATVQRPVPRPPAASAPAPAPAEPAKPAFDNLEDEMASLLGRPKPPA